MSSTNSEKPLMQNYQIRAHEGGRVLCFDPSSQRVTIQESVANESVDLGFAPSRILQLLISRADTIVTRDEIFEFAWPGRVVGQNSLNQAIATLRELLGDDEKRLIIQTIPRHGYRLSSAFVSVAVELPGREVGESQAGQSVAPAERAADEVVVVDASARSGLWQRLWRVNPYWQRAGLCALVAVLALSLLWRIDWGLLTQSGMVTVSRQVGPQQQLFVAPNSADVSVLMDEVSSVSRRLGG
ncbi:winged helix-turn-helix domain-containing protein [Pseudomonas sp. SL4(2022)]|uniref:winged helix-turn-helix domain-containing protein n=1 Tax=Pseudomonas sp. SL4(2022) TaxID=2994661 RepID=UPI00226F591C|nr:winged helix-turn-helix domain-containing protein [Pseudomonas sp. SL4(2022)]WAC46453.1 winged helix-turn-helix domain-containing protein [Pseudomonas sp. SL4(2022)]